LARRGDGSSRQRPGDCEEYDKLLEDAGIRFNRQQKFALPIGKKLQALGAATDPHKSERLLDATYNVIWRLAKKNGLHRLKDVIVKQMPDSGIYLFFDERERRLKDYDRLRIVRVGTHGVSSRFLACQQALLAEIYNCARVVETDRCSIAVSLKAAARIIHFDDYTHSISQGA
jgi:hypothetical protein